MTYFTIKRAAASLLYPVPRYGVHTLHLESGVWGGMFYYPTPEKARASVTAAYRTPLQEVDWPTYREAVQRAQARLVYESEVRVG